jgi:hypothetical protein
VGPAPGAEQKIAFLLPTASYMAYGNDRLAMDGGGCEVLNNCVNIIGPQDIFLNGHPEYGGSLYDAHSDGSGICHSSRLRPLVTMRPRRQGVLGGFGGSKLWQFNADTHILDWLETTGFPFDVITDEELDASGAALLAPYKTVITGTHPEYYSTKMWHAVRDYRASSNCAAARPACAPGRPHRARPRRPLMASRVGCGKTSANPRRAWPAWDSRRRALMFLGILSAGRIATGRKRRLFSRAWVMKRSAILG